VANPGGRAKGAFPPPLFPMDRYSNRRALHGCIGRMYKRSLPQRQNPKRATAVWRPIYGPGQELVANKCIYLRLLVMSNRRRSWAWGSRWAGARASAGSNDSTKSRRFVGRPSCRGCAARRATWKPETDIERERVRETRAGPSIAEPAGPDLRMCVRCIREHTQDPHILRARYTALFDKKKNTCQCYMLICVIDVQMSNCVVINVHFLRLNAFKIRIRSSLAREKLQDSLSSPRQSNRDVPKQL